MNYKPNYKDKRTLATSQRIVEWLETNIGGNPNKRLMSTLLRKPEAFGDSQLGRYLRNYLLIKVNPSFQPGKFSQQYRIDIDRLNKLRIRIGLEPTKLKRNDIEGRFEAQVDAIESGNFPYNESHGRWHNGLQNISKIIKEHEFAKRGYEYDYDIECCAPTLFLQRAGQLKPKMKSLPFYNFYLTNKTEVRDELCIKYNLSKTQIKQILNGLFQGGILNTYYDNKIFGYIGKNSFKMKQLKQDEYLIELQKEIKYIWKILRDDVSVVLKTNFKRLNGKYKSDYYKRLEELVMTNVWTYLKKNKVKHFREHDGFRSTEFVIPNELEQIVKIKTGYQVKFVWSKIECNVERGLDI
jgi:hypothetical protein